WDFYINHGGLEKSKLQFPELFPINHVGEQVDFELAAYPFNVLNRQLGVPSIVKLHRQRPNSPFFQFIGKVTTIDATTQSENAIVLVVRASLFDRFNRMLQFSPRALAAGQGLHEAMVFMTIIAYSRVVKTDVAQRGVQNTTGANLIKIRCRFHGHWC